MRKFTKPDLPREHERRFWRAIRAGMTLQEATDSAGASLGWGSRLLAKAGGVNPAKTTEPSGERYLRFEEREEIMRLQASGLGVRAIAREIDRNPSTVSRELKRAVGVRGYRASMAQTHADRGRRGPRNAKLATNLRLRREVQTRLEGRDSPEQIAGRLKVDFPDEPEMWVSVETIYQSLYIQARGGLKRELTAYLRTGRSMRKPRRAPGYRRTRIPDMVMISERPAEVEDRAVPGHWEGDLIMGSKSSDTAVGTLVERTTGFVMLLHLPDGHGTLAVQQALVAKMLTLDEHLRRSLTWDQGLEMASHREIAKATGLDIYFCDPHSPWQRGTNENTNGLLRQYLPKGKDLSFFGPGMLDNIAAELNSRPRKRHGFRTPAEMLEKILTKTADNHGVA
ncbi:IS30 family transposase [Nocardioides cavernae]|uniref:IS30 family transposase n=1 Tax=Nocardioides TaxID=1839 RepID=UPI0009EB3328|nr:IS30 family transposase [Nocardioides cavernae]MCK9826132.1 IS30 family transposase [Nocardioides cavernae]